MRASSGSRRHVQNLDNNLEASKGIIWPMFANHLKGGGVFV